MDKLTKQLVQEAQDLLDHLCENICPVFTDTGDLDPFDDFEEIRANLSNVEREWYDLWMMIYDEVDCFITNHKE